MPLQDLANDQRAAPGATEMVTEQLRQEGLLQARS